MPLLLSQLASDGPLVLIAAAPLEIRAILDGSRRAGFTGEDPGRSIAAEGVADWRPVRLAHHLYVVRTGVGKVNAAAATTLCLERLRPGCLINLGICGVLPHITGPAGGAPPALLETVLASRSVYADEGLLGPRGFQTTAQLGFPMGPFPDPAIPISDSLEPLLRPLAQNYGGVATVSTCSATDGLALETARRTGAIAEAMEGAAIAHVVAKFNELQCAAPDGGPAALGPLARFAEFRVVSNTTGDRERQQWRLKESFGALEHLTHRLLSS